MQEKRKKSIVFFTKYGQAGASSRYRSFQYFPYYKKAGYTVIWKPLIPDHYISRFYKTGRKPLLSLLIPYLKRFTQLLFLNRSAIIYVEYELFPYLPFFIERWLLGGNKSLILDYDDAIFVNYDSHSNKLVRWLLSGKIFNLAKRSRVAITGSPFLSACLQPHAPKVIEVPTSIEFEKYQKGGAVTRQENNVFTIGWIGSKTTSYNIALIIEALKTLQKRYTILLALVGFDLQQQAMLQGVNHIHYEWNRETEIDLVSSFDVGVMPLFNNDFNRGKCGFKLIQYMACSKPTISTPLDANKKINHDNENLFADSTEEWLTAFEALISRKDYFQRVVGAKNRQIVAEYYSVEANLVQYLDVFDGINED